LTSRAPIPPEVMEREPIEVELAEETSAEEPIELTSILEAPPEKPKEKHIRFAEDILLGTLKAEIPDKEKGRIKGKRTKKVIKYKKQEDHFIDDDVEE